MYKYTYVFERKKPEMDDFVRKKNLVLKETLLMFLMDTLANNLPPK